MNFSEYQDAASRTASTRLSLRDRRTIAALGLTGEAGEVAELFKKWAGHDVPYTKDQLTKELGDVLWYLSELASLNEVTLEDIAQANVAKLKARYPEGFVTGGGNR